MNRRAADRNYWTAVGVIPRWQLVAVYALVVAAGFAGFLSIGSAVHKANDAARQSRALAARANDQALQTKRLAVRIQHQRKELCQDQNDRHDRTIKRLDALTAKLPPAERARAKAGRAGTLQLINALAPRRHCAEIHSNP